MAVTMGEYCLLGCDTGHVGIHFPKIREKLLRR